MGPVADQAHLVSDLVGARAAAQPQRPEGPFPDDDADGNAGGGLVGLAREDPDRREHAQPEDAPLRLLEGAVVERLALFDRQPRLLPDDVGRDARARGRVDLDVAEEIAAAGVDDQRQVREPGLDVDERAPLDGHLQVAAVAQPIRELALRRLPVLLAKHGARRER